MTADLSPYLAFRDTARQAMTFYQSVFGGELKMYPYAAFGVSSDPAEQDKITYAVLTTPGGFVLRATDIPDRDELVKGTNDFFVCLNGAWADDRELRGYWAGLTEGGSIATPLERAPWGDAYGMCTDRFGVTWKVNIEGERPAQDV